jgi:hypothetical protein
VALYENHATAAATAAAIAVAMVTVKVLHAHSVPTASAVITYTQVVPNTDVC